MFFSRFFKQSLAYTPYVVNGNYLCFQKTTQQQKTAAWRRFKLLNKIAIRFIKSAKNA